MNALRLLVLQFSESQDALAPRPNGWFLDLKASVVMWPSHNQCFVFSAFTFYMESVSPCKFSQFFETLSGQDMAQPFLGQTFCGYAGDHDFKTVLNHRKHMLMT